MRVHRKRSSSKPEEKGKIRVGDVQARVEASRCGIALKKFSLNGMGPAEVAGLSALLIHQPVLRGTVIQKLVAGR